jgi:hypothetical protein
VPASLLASLLLLTSGATPGIRTDLGDARLRDEVAEAANVAWRETAHLLGADAVAPTEPLPTLHLHATRAAFEAAIAPTSRAPRSGLAWTEPGGGAAHVALQPPLGPGALAELGVPSQTLRLVAHETAHLARARLAPAHASHPRWLADGLASLVERRTLARLGRTAGRAEDPFDATDLVLLQRLHRTGRLPRARAVLEDDLEGLELGERYAVRAALVRVLAGPELEQLFAALLSGVAAVPAGPGAAYNVRARVDELLGARTLEALDAELRSSITAARPRWDEPARALDTSREAWVQAAFPDAPSQAWRLPERGGAGGRLVLTGAVEHAPGSTGGLMLLVGRTPQDHHAVVLEPDGGAAVLHLGVGAPRELARAAPTAAAGGPRAFRLEVAEGRLRLIRPDAPDLEARTHPLPPSWGLGAAPGAAGRWHGVEARTLPPTDRP